MIMTAKIAATQRKPGKQDRNDHQSLPRETSKGQEEEEEDGRWPI
jgi:hypothetical protein